MAGYASKELTQVNVWRRNEVICDLNRRFFVNLYPKAYLLLAFILLNALAAGVLALSSSQNKVDGQAFITGSFSGGNSILSSGLSFDKPSPGKIWIDSADIIQGRMPLTPFPMFAVAPN
jgi:hypothetical protein